MEKVLVIHGPNLNLLGTREPGIYGAANVESLDKALLSLAQELKISLEIYQSNHEGAIIDRIHQALGQAQAIIINPGAYTHYSYAIRDAIAAVAIPTVEVHISNTQTREEFRHHSVISPVVVGTITGFGLQSYLLALRAAATLIHKED